MGRGFRSSVRFAATMPRWSRVEAGLGAAFIPTRSILSTFPKHSGATTCGRAYRRPARCSTHTRAHARLRTRVSTGPTTRGDDARSARRHLRTPARATWFPPARALASTSCVTSALPHPGREYCIHKRGVAAASHISHARSSTPPPTLHAPPPTARHLHSGLQPGCSLTWIPRRAAPRGRVRGAGGCTDTECGR